MGAGALVSGSVSTTVCSVVLGALTIEVGGAGMLACGVIFTGSVGYAGGELGSKFGEMIGEKIYEVQSDGFVFDVLVIGTGGVILLSAVTMVVLSILNKTLL
jgi:hypothetical protein